MKKIARYSQNVKKFNERKKKVIRDLEIYFSNLAKYLISLFYALPLEFSRELSIFFLQKQMEAI